jgi:hypothetical protein
MPTLVPRLAQVMAILTEVAVRDSGSAFELGWPHAELRINGRRT